MMNGEEKPNLWSALPNNWAVQHFDNWKIHHTYFPATWERDLGDGEKNAGFVDWDGRWTKDGEGPIPDAMTKKILLE